MDNKNLFEQTEAMEHIIIEVGSTKELNTMINLKCSNKIGKTAIGAQIICNIIFEPEKTYIIGSSKKVKDNGLIRKEIEKWWP